MQRKTDRGKRQTTQKVHKRTLRGAAEPDERLALPLEEGERRETPKGTHTAQASEGTWRGRDAPSRRRVPEKTGRADFACSNCHAAAPLLLICLPSSPCPSIPSLPTQRPLPAPAVFPSAFPSLRGHTSEHVGGSSFRRPLS